MYLEKILLADDVVKSIRENINYLLNIMPELKFMMGFEQNNPNHHLDVWKHTLLALDLSKNDFDVRLGLLLHDIGKPFSYQDTDVRHFHGHAKISANISKGILERLNFDDEYVKKMCYLIKNHDKKVTDELIESNYDLAETLYEMQKGDALAHHPDSLESRKVYLNEVEEKLSLYSKTHHQTK